MTNQQTVDAMRTIVKRAVREAKQGLAEQFRDLPLSAVDYAVSEAWPSPRNCALSVMAEVEYLKEKEEENERSK